MKALIVDDVAIMRVVMREALVSFCKFKKENIFEAANGQEALSKYKSEKPDIVFLDITMPKMDGLEAVKELILIDPKAKIVMCTSSGDESDVLYCIKAGATDYITKPPQPKRIVQAVEKIFGPLNPVETDDDDFDDFDDEEEVEDTKETKEETAALKSKIEQLEAELAALKKSESSPVESSPDESSPDESSPDESSPE